MRRLIAILAAVSLAATLTGCLRAPAGSPDESSVPVTGSSLHTIPFDGGEREYRLFAPAALPDGPVELVVMLHGGFGSAEQAERTYGWDAQALRDGFIVVYPEGVGRSWNGGGCCGPAMKQSLDDVAFIEAVVADVRREFDIDPDRVFATGMSNGAIMAYRLACESSVFAAVAPVSGTMLVGCDGAAPTSVLHIHGAQDQSIPPDGSPGGGTQHIDGPPLADVLERWRQIDGCGTPVSAPIAGDPLVTATTSTPCEDGTAVEYIEIADAGHQWPGSGSSEIRDELGGDPPSPHLDATATIAAFFAAHPREG